MNRLAKILAPTDLSELSCVGVRRALDMARAEGAEVILYHVIVVAEDWFSRHDESVPVRELVTREEQNLDKFLREKFADCSGSVEIRQSVELGGAAANILDKAEREGVDLIVMSTHGRTGIDHMLVGSVTEKVVARAPCPVLVIPPSGRRVPVARVA